MSEEDFENIDISNLLRSYDDKPKRSLEELFELKIKQLSISKSQALEAMQIESRALNSILNGTSSRIDIMSLVKLAKFLEISDKDAIMLFLDILYRPDSVDIEVLEKRKFILNNFDINELKKEGIIQTVADFDHIEHQLISTFNYNSIFDYRREVMIPLYSSSKSHKENKMCDYWVEYARLSFIKINNTNPYNRKALIEYFPKIRWHTMNVEKGLWEVVKELYKMGVSIIYLPKFKKLHIRGATFSVNKKPCIVLTDYKGFYPTLWFSLLHELHHVLFDWDDILVNSYHLSESPDSVSLYNKVEIEDVADEFAKQYLFSKEKLNELSPHINDPEYVSEYAKRNHVHVSIPYAFWAFESGKWGWVRKFMPNMDECLKRVKEVSLNMSVNEVADFNTKTIFSNERA